MGPPNRRQPQGYYWKKTHELCHCQVAINGRPARLKIRVPEFPVVQNCQRYHILIPSYINPSSHSPCCGRRRHASGLVPVILPIRGLCLPRLSSSSHQSWPCLSDQGIESSTPMYHRPSRRRAHAKLRYSGLIVDVPRLHELDGGTQTNTWQQECQSPNTS
jgi:hypothetical protein